MNISFGRKIPIIKCQIQDTDTGKFEPATVYQIDCKDESDVLEIRNLPDTWQYKLGIAKNMDRKHQLLKHYNQAEDVRRDMAGEVRGPAAQVRGSSPGELQPWEHFPRKLLAGR